MAQGFNREDAIRALTELGGIWTVDLATGTIDNVIASGNNPGVGITPGFGGGAPSITPQPGVTQAPVGPITPEDFAELISGPDVERRFAVDTGITPGLRGFARGFANRQRFPFALNAATQSASGISPEDFRETITTRGFEDFLGQLGSSGVMNVGQSLRGAADFLRNPSLDGEFSTQQQFISDLLRVPGAIGSEAFAPIVRLLGQGAGRLLFGQNQFGGAVQESTSNFLAANPRRFNTAQEFIDFLGQQNVIA
ncbi:MAG: hypothetical protein IH999_08685 [Proteobacteria bacterium]|nr:hypothetical protein [Pseudomonadota bacterium]